jgi:hypothetical protein
MLDGEPLSQEIRLTNGFTISCFASTQRGLRACSITAAVLDELAFFRLEGQTDSDEEIQASIRRGGLSLANPKLVKISTPYLRSGVLYADYKRAFGIGDPDLLVWVAGSTLMNPSISEAQLARERRLDPVRSRREYDAGFSEDIGAFVSVGVIDMNVCPPIKEASYFGAVDPSGGGAGAFTFSICHATENKIVQDVLRGWTKVKGEPTDLDAIVREIVYLAKSYNLRFLTWNRFAAGGLPQAFRNAGMRYIPSSRNRSECFLSFEPLLLGARMELLDHPAVHKELQLVERTNHPGGRVSINHPKGNAYHDDHANVTAMSAVIVEASRPRDGDDEDSWERDRPEDGAVMLARSADAVAKWTEQLLRVGFTAERIQEIVEESGEDCAETLETALADVTLRGRMKRAGQDHHDLLGRLRERPGRRLALLRLEGRHRDVHERAGDGAGRAAHQRQLHRPRLHQGGQRDVAAEFRLRYRAHQEHPVGAVGHAGGHRAGRAVPGLTGGRLRDRRGARRQRRGLCRAHVPAAQHPKAR